MVKVRRLSTLHWLLIAAALGIAAVSLLRAWRISTRLRELSAAYWELRYEQGQLKARLARLEPPDDPPGEEPLTGVTAFVPLSSIKR